MIENREFACNSNCAYDVFGYPQGVKTRLNTCSDRYNLVSNESVIVPMRNMLLDKASGLKVKEEYQIINNAQFYGKYIIDVPNLKIGSNDDLKVIFGFNKSYNGLTPYELWGGLFRQVCSNGLCVPYGEKNEYSLSIKGKHTEKLNSKLDELYERIHLFINNAPKIIQPFIEMSGISVPNYGDRIIEVLGANGIALVQNQKFSTLTNIKETVETEASKLQIKPNDWIIYNAINQYIFDEDRVKVVPEIRRDSDQKVLNFMLKKKPSKTALALI